MIACAHKPDKTIMAVLSRVVYMGHAAFTTEPREVEDA